MKAVRYKSGEVEANILFLLVAMFFLTSSFFIDAGNYPAWSSAKIVPILLSSVMAICSASSLMEAIRKRQVTKATENVFQVKVLTYIGVFFVYIGALFLLPFWLASAAFLLFSFLFWKSLPLVKAIVASAAVVAVSLTLFSKVFYITF